MPERAQPAQEPGNGDEVATARLARVEEEKREADQAAKYNQMPKVGFGSQIRSYFLHPDQRVKDARTGYSETNFHNVLDGHIQEFLDAYLRYLRGEVVFGRLFARPRAGEEEQTRRLNGEQFRLQYAGRACAGGRQSARAGPMERRAGTGRVGQRQRPLPGAVRRCRT